MFCLATEICRRTRLQAGSDNLKDITDRLKLRVRPTTTKTEREMLMKIAECKSQKDIDKLLAIFYTQQNMDPMCRYIRLAFATAAELWSSRLLLTTDHNESWFRTHFTRLFSIMHLFTMISSLQKEQTATYASFVAYLHYTMGKILYS